MVIDHAGRNVLIIEDTAGVSTTDASETNLFNAAPASNGFLPLGDFAGGKIFIELFNSVADTGVGKAYTAITQAVTYQTQHGSNITISASSGVLTTVAEAGKYLRVTITRTTNNITVRYRIIVLKAGGTL